MPTLILFDIDGTLILTGGAGTRGMTRAFRDVFQVADAFRGVPMPGRTDPLILAEAVARAGILADDDLLARFTDRYATCLAEELRVDAPGKAVMPGVRTLLDRLDARPDVFLALLTGNYREAARLKLQHFGLWHYFRCGAFGEDAPTRDGLVPVAMARAQACGAPALSPRDVIVVGDTPLDVACAKAGNARAVAVATGGFDVDTLRASGADVVFETLSDSDAFLALLDGRMPGTRFT